MRVLQLISSNGFYGAESVVALLSSNLTALGCDVAVGMFNATRVSSHGMVSALARDGVELCNFPCQGRADLRTVLAISRYLRRERVDVLHTHGYKANVYGLIAARLAGCKILATCHNWTDRTPSLRRYAMLDRLLLARFDSIVAVSDSISDALRGRSRIKNRLLIIPNGVDLDRYRPDSTVTLAGTAIVIGAVSRLSPEKGVDVLLRALPQIVHHHPKVRCVVVGEGPERERLTTLTVKLGVANSIVFPGFCDDIPSFLRSCTVVVHPSRMEAMPLAILEAMAAGRAIVASEVGGIPELLRGGRAGVLVPPGDSDSLATAVCSMLDRPDERKCFEVAALNHVHEHFRADLMAQRYLDAYSRLNASPNTMCSLLRFNQESANDSSPGR